MKCIFRVVWVVGRSCIEVELRDMSEEEKKEGTERREGGTLYPGMAAKFL